MYVENEVESDNDTKNMLEESLDITLARVMSMVLMLTRFLCWEAKLKFGNKRVWQGWVFQWYSCEGWWPHSCSQIFLVNLIRTMLRCKSCLKMIETNKAESRPPESLGTWAHVPRHIWNMTGTFDPFLTKWVPGGDSVEKYHQLWCN